MMKVIKNHFTKSKKVTSYSQIERAVADMQFYIRNGGFHIGNYERGYALAHSQVSTEPFAFFVLNPSWPETKLFKHDVIINPELIETWRDINIGTKKEPDMRSNTREYPEGCFSFPFRQGKKVKRYFRIKVRYQVQGGLFGLKTITETIEGLPAHVFQHEEQHCRGGNIYFKQ